MAAIYQAINDQVQAIRGLEEKEPVTPTIVSPAELTEVLRKTLDEQTPPEVLGAYERLYKAMGLLPADASLIETFSDLLESQVAGVFDPKSKQLYVLSKEGRVGAVERFFYAHEYEHALQDQHYDLSAVQEGLTDQTDRALARQSMVEGDAYVVMTLWAQANMGPGDLLAVLAASNDPKAQEVLESIPKIVQSQVLFSAIQGTTWILGIQSQGGWEAVDAVWERPPESTEQVLHPEKYAAGEEPIEVELPANLAAGMGPGWKAALEDTFGEHQIAVWLEETADIEQADAAESAAGWGGDRLVSLEGPGGAWAIAWKTAWDSAAEARSFATDARAAIGASTGSGDVLAGASDVESWIVLAGDAATLGRLTDLLAPGG